MLLAVDLEPLTSRCEVSCSNAFEISKAMVLHISPQLGQSDENIILNGLLASITSVNIGSWFCP